nr:MAG TPA: hypothetical protein [Caudoviricetes sp.]
MAKAKEATTKKQTDRFTVAEVREQLLATMIKNNQDIIQCVANTEQMLEELNDIKTKMAILEEEQAANKASIEKQAAKLDSFVETEAEVSTKVDTLSATLVDHIDKYDSNVKANLEDKAEQLKELFVTAEPIKPEEFIQPSISLTPVYILLAVMIIVNLFVLYHVYY